MPNWCHCTLKVSGDTEALERFVEQAKISEDRIRELWDGRVLLPEGEQLSYEDFAKRVRENQPLSFASFVPQPTELPPGTDLMPDWYNWRLKNWGTKWDASFNGPAAAIVSEDADLDATVEAQGSTITKFAAFYKFDTAWSPPAAFVDIVAGQLPTLTFTLRFAEVGNGFAGQLIYEDGAVVEDIELEIEDVLAPEELWF